MTPLKNRFWYSIKTPFGTAASLVLALLLIRIVYYGFLPAFTAIGQNVWFTPVFDVSTYALTALFLVLFRDDLAQYNIDDFSVGIIILFKPIASLMEYLGGLRSTTLTSLLLLTAIAIALLFFYARKKPWKSADVRSDLKLGFKRLLLGFGAGIVLCLLFVIPMAFDFVARNPGDWREMDILPNLLSNSLWRIPQQLGYAAILEEPLFRGFLWGMLLQLKLKNSAILFIQAALFTLAHIYYIPQGNWLSFLLIVPVGAVVFGLLVTKEKSIAVSMAAHAVFNAITMNLALVACFVLKL